MNVLVTGGAGYIGAVTADVLVAAGHQVVIVDDLRAGDRARVAHLPFYKIATHDTEAVISILQDHQIDAVIHFAASIEAGESMQNPGKYFTNNVTGSLHLLTAMQKVGVTRFVFSSTAAVYGIPTQVPIPETAQLQPINAYGSSKHIVEQLIAWYHRIHNLSYVVLRYFNAAGAHTPSAHPHAKWLGESHQPETHLIPNILSAVQHGQDFNLFGNDYKTKDGTCIRDYIHVTDLALAHSAALQALATGVQAKTLNVGTGNGYSNAEVIDMVKQVTQQDISVVQCPRRAGDPDVLVANSTKISHQFDWKPSHSDLKSIIDSAWQWQRYAPTAKLPEFE